jgi:hypothetical protein
MVRLTTKENNKREKSSANASDREKRREKAKEASLRCLKSLINIGSAGKTRTYNPSVNSRMLCH